MKLMNIFLEYALAQNIWCFVIRTIKPAWQWHHKHSYVPLYPIDNEEGY